MIDSTGSGIAWLLEPISRHHLSSRLCSAHFKAEDFLKRDSAGRRLLRPDAVPSTFDEIPSNLKPSITPLRKPPAKHRSTHSTVAPVPSVSLEENIVDLDASSSVPSVVEVASIVAHDHTYCVCKPAHELQALVHVLTTKLEEKTEQLRNSHRKLPRRNVILKTTLDLLQQFRESNLLTASDNDLLERNFSGMKLSVLQGQIANAARAKHQRRYSANEKLFAMTLNFLSPKAYR